MPIFKICKVHVSIHIIIPVQHQYSSIDVVQDTIRVHPFFYYLFVILLRYVIIIT